MRKHLSTPTLEHIHTCSHSPTHIKKRRDRKNRLGESLGPGLGLDVVEVLAHDELAHELAHLGLDEATPAGFRKIMKNIQLNSAECKKNNVHF